MAFSPHPRILYGFTQHLKISCMGGLGALGKKSPGSHCTAFRNFGMICSGHLLRDYFDISSRPDDDLLTVPIPYNLPALRVQLPTALQNHYFWPRLGMIRAVVKLLRVKERGILGAGLPCNSWVFINRSTSGRTKGRIFGTPKYQYVKMANVSLGLRICCNLKHVPYPG